MGGRVFNGYKIFKRHKKQYPEHKQSLKSLLLYIKIKFLTGKWHFKCKYLKAKQNKRKHKTCFKKITHLNGISLCM